MKTIISLFLSLVSINAFAFDIGSITLKQDLQLQAVAPADYYSAQLSVCLDAKTKNVLPSEACSYNHNHRVCELFVYNFKNVEGAVTLLPAGTKFIVTEQFGPRISRDWSKKTSSVKIFADLTGHQEPASNPNLILECSQTNENFFGPRSFSMDELADVFSEFVEIQ